MRMVNIINRPQHNSAIQQHHNQPEVDLTNPLFSNGYWVIDCDNCPVPNGNTAEQVQRQCVKYIWYELRTISDWETESRSRGEKPRCNTPLPSCCLTIRPAGLPQSVFTDRMHSSRCLCARLQTLKVRAGYSPLISLNRDSKLDEHRFNAGNYFSGIQIVCS